MQPSKLFEILPPVLLMDFLRYFIAAGAAYLFYWVIFKKNWSHRNIQGKPLIASKMWFEFRYSMSTVLIFALIGYGLVLSKQAGLTMIYDNIAEYGWWWFVASVVVMILLHDAYFYWVHRLMHHPLLFRHVHLVHHRSTNPSPWAAYAFHPLEAVIEAAFLPLMAFTIPLHGLALFTFLAYMVVRNVIGHLGIEILPRWFLENTWINWHTSTTHHDLHHKYFHYNYGLYFTWWDKWFGTENNEYHTTFHNVTSRPKNISPPESHQSTKQPVAVKSKILVSLTVLLFGTAVMTNAQSVSRLWQTSHEQSGQPLSLIQIEETPDNLVGKVMKIYLQPWEGADPICTKCPGERQGQRVIGMEFLWDFRNNGSDWTGGKILDPAAGTVYDSKLWLKNDSTMKVRGYAGPMNLFHRTQTWKRQVEHNDDNPITGVWKTIDDVSGNTKSLVKITDDNGVLSGSILKIFLQPWEGLDPICTECPGAKHNAKIVGMTFLGNFTKDTTGTLDRWSDGNIMDPGNGKTYTSAIWLEDPNTLKVRGFWGPFYRTQTWKRVTQP